MTAASSLLDRLPEMPGCVLTFDALYAARGIMEKVVIDKDADYLVQVKGNAPALREKLEQAFSRKKNEILRAETFDYAHGRIETRALEMIPLLPTETGWPHTHTACRVTRSREVIRRGETVNSSTEQALHVGSFPATAHKPEHVLHLIRGHWGIENTLHHPKDRSMDEDRNRASEKGIGRVMSCLRSLAALIFRRAKESSSVIRRRLSRKTNYLLSLLDSKSLRNWERQVKPYKLV